MRSFQAWRKIMDSRSWCKGFFISKIGNGKSTSLWFDYWLPDGGRIVDCLPATIIASTGLNWNSQVADIIRSGDWNFPTGHLDLQQIWNVINFKPNSHEDDHIVWTGQAGGKFTIDSAWNMVREKKQNNPLHDIIWYSGRVPRYAFILWLASMGRLSTMDRPYMRNIADSHHCVLCGNEVESHSHLFFQCGYSGGVWQSISAQTNLHWPNLQWGQLLNWGANAIGTKKGFRNLLMRHAIHDSVFFVDREKLQGVSRPSKARRNSCA